MKRTFTVKVIMNGGQIMHKTRKTSRPIVIDDSILDLNLKKINKPRAFYVEPKDEVEWMKCVSVCESAGYSGDNGRYRSHCYIFVCFSKIIGVGKFMTINKLNIKDKEIVSGKKFLDENI